MSAAGPSQGANWPPRGTRGGQAWRNERGHARFRFRRRGAARAACGAPAPHHGGQPAGTRGRCVRGVPRLEKADGRAFIPDAIARGAGAVLWEALSFHWDAAWRVSNVAVDDLKAKLGAIAHHIYGHPSSALFVVGVTGNERQDVVHALDRAVLRRLRPEERDPGHARQRTRRRARCVGAHDARRRGGPRDARPAQERGGEGRRDGSFVAWSRPGTRQRRRVRYRAVHEPDARSPRLPRDDGGLRRSEGAACSRGPRSLPASSTPTILSAARSPMRRDRAVRTC